MTTVEPTGTATTGTARTLLGRTRRQVTKLVETGLLTPVGRTGRTALLDLDALRALGAREPLPRERPGPGVEPYALAVGLGPVPRVGDGPAADAARLRGRPCWDHTCPPPDEAWTGWWNVGLRTAALCAASGLPLLGAVSGYVVAVRTVVDWVPHPTVPGRVRFVVRPAPQAVEARFADTQFRPPAGQPWSLLHRRITADGAAG